MGWRDYSDGRCALKGDGFVAYVRPDGNGWKWLILVSHGLVSRTLGHGSAFTREGARRQAEATLAEEGL